MRLEEAILINLYTSKDIWDRYFSLIEEDFFISSTYRQIFNLIHMYWTDVYKGSEENKLSSIRELAIIELQDNQTSLNNIFRVLEKISTKSISPDTEALFTKALMNWRTRRVLTKAIEDLSSNKLDIDYFYSEVEKLVSIKDVEEEEEISPHECVEEILQEENTGSRYTTGLTRVDELLEGGLWAGEIGMVLGPSFRGKTWALIHLGAAALSAKIPVIHFTLEISRRRVAIRYFQSLLERTRKAIRADTMDSGKAIRDLNLPPWSIKDYSASPANTSQIDRDVREFIARTGTTPLVIIDYGDLVTPVSKQGVGNEYISLGKVIEELRRLANKYSTGVWTASQTNRLSYDKVLIGMAEVADSIKKIQTADVIITLNQNMEEHKNLLMRWYIDKARERELEEKEVRLVAKAAFQKFEDGI